MSDRPLTLEDILARKQGKPAVTSDEVPTRKISSGVPIEFVVTDRNTDTDTPAPTTEGLIGDEPVRPFYQHQAVKSATPPKSKK